MSDELVAQLLEAPDARLVIARAQALLDEEAQHRDYTLTHDLGEVDTEKALVTLTRNDYEPAICFWRKEVADTFTDETRQHPAPDLVVEVLSKSTEKRDRATSVGASNSKTRPRMVYANAGSSTPGGNW